MKTFCENAKRPVVTLAGILLALVLSSWGHTGHYKINSRAELSYNQLMNQFYQWTSLLADHASDADIRKSWDPDEGPKHYIDIDNYPEFLNSGTIPQNLEDAIAQHGYNFVYDQGILPWATITAFDSLQACFERSDWDQALLFAADLGHYIADGHMPLHVTRNYNGQYTGNQGVHSRYESEMIDIYHTQIDYPGHQIAVINNVNQYVFNYIYENYAYVDSVLDADDYATSLTGSTSSSDYYEALWEKSENFTSQLFENASHTLAELIYTAWVNAGSPLIAGVFNPGAVMHRPVLKVYPNPLTTFSKVTLQLHEPSDVRLDVRNFSGERLSTLTSGNLDRGSHDIRFPDMNLSPGVYFLCLNAGRQFDIKKVIVTD